MKKNTFKQADLQKKIGIEPLSEIDEIPNYNTAQRVKCRNLKGPWQEIVIKPHSLAEIDTKEFRTFLKEAAAAFVAYTNRTALNLNDLTPWKQLGKKWHLSRKGFPSNKRVAWSATLLEKLFDGLEKLYPDATVDYTGKTVVTYTRPGEKKPFLRVQTKRRTNIELQYTVKKGSIATGSLTDFDPELRPKGASEELLLRITKATQIATVMKAGI